MTVANSLNVDLVVQFDICLNLMAAGGSANMLRFDLTD
jgi:hypothetical protein